MHDINKNTVLYNKFRRKFMKEVIAFFKDIFMLGDSNCGIKIGLSQFKGSNKDIKKKVKKVAKIQKEVKLSDLMRRSA